MSPTLNVPVGAPHARIMGVGAYRPERVVTNAEICERIDSSDEWIRERSGIETRHRAAYDETVVDMAEAAVKGALKYAGLEGSDVDMIIMSTVTHPYQTPSAASLLAPRIGATSPVAFDISAACAGFCHGVALANDAIKGGSAKHVVVVGVEKLSDFTNPEDRSTAFIFGDGAGAVVIGPSDTPGISQPVWGSDGEKWDLINHIHNWIDTRDHDAGWPWLTMQGQSVFRWAVWKMSPIAQQALDVAGVSAEDLGVFIPHQANIRIVDSMVKQMRLPADLPVARDIVNTGNTSAASIPLAMHRILTEGVAKSGDLALLIGFGAGLVYAAQVVVLP